MFQFHMLRSATLRLQTTGLRSLERDGYLLGRIENEVKEENEERRRMKEGRRRSHPCVSRSESAARRRWLCDYAGILKWRSRQASWPIAFAEVSDRRLGQHDVYVIVRKRERKELSRSTAELLILGSVYESLIIYIKKEEIKNKFLKKRTFLLIKY